MNGVLDALVALPYSALLGAALAFRPRRRGTPPRNPAVIETQIILAMIGALVMIVVGASLARAFGIVGAASLVRYRAKISDPKDAGVMLAALGIGLAVGVQLYAVAALAVVFFLGVLWMAESLERHAYKEFELKVATKSPQRLRPSIEHLLARHHARAELRAVSADEIEYAVRLPLSKRIDPLSNEILKLDRSGATEVEWDEKKVPR